MQRRGVVGRRTDSDALHTVYRRETSTMPVDDFLEASGAHG